MTSDVPGTSETEAWYRGLQDRLCAALESLDGTSRFVRDRWERPEGGGGDTGILQGDGPIEKAAVNVSAVWGDTPAGLSEQMAAASDRFFATGISVIVHPRNPHAPTFHANLRHFATDATSWFGGGLDLTPYYLYPEDVRHFHGTLADACGRHDVADHSAWKAACDDYFYLPHHGEARGVGGIFFDHLTERLDEMWAFQRDLGDHIADAYLPILERRIDAPYGSAEEEWHLRRRGRYAEFNLVWDRGTRFGLETGGRTESILASLPPRARWDYGATPVPGTREAELLDMVKGPPQDWLS
jgi:coproporphyrinogen III oxidase